MMNMINNGVVTGNAFIDEMRKYVLNDKNGGMFDIFYGTVQFIGTERTMHKMESLMTDMRTTHINGYTFHERRGDMTDEVLFMIHDDIRMMNVHIDGECNMINGEEYSIDTIISKVFETYLFVFLDDADYDSLLNCEHGDNHEYGDVCECGNIVMRTLMNVKRHAILNKNSDDIVLATLIGTALMRE